MLQLEKLLTLKISSQIPIWLGMILMLGLNHPTLVEARGGSISTGGGGNIILLENQESKQIPDPLLLDFFDAPDEVADSIDSFPSTEDPLPQSPQELGLVKIILGTTYSIPDVTSLRSYQYLKERLQEWQIACRRDSINSPEAMDCEWLIQLIQESVDEIDWRVTTKKLENERLEIPKRLKDLHAQGINFTRYTIAEYSFDRRESKSSVTISRQEWERKLSVQTRAGLLLHETLRQIQIRNGFEFDESILQKLTARIILAEPDRWLANESSLGQALMQTIEARSNLLADLVQFDEDYCKPNTFLNLGQKLNFCKPQSNDSLFYETLATDIQLLTKELMKTTDSELEDNILGALRKLTEFLERAVKFLLKNSWRDLPANLSNSYSVGR